MKSELLKFGVAGLTAAGTLFAQCKAQAQLPEHPNIVLIITDQQQAGKLSWYGDTQLSTPTMDRLASQGVNFCNSYSTFPLSIPQRFALFTGMYPSSINLRFNPTSTKDKETIDFEEEDRLRGLMLGEVFHRAGYDTFYGGKAHLLSPYGNEDTEYFGFRHNYSPERRNLLGADAAELLSHKTPKDRPFLMVVSYINPHDICEYDDYVDLPHMTKSRKTKHEGLSRVARYINETTYKWSPEEFYSSIAPPLPDNFPIMEGMPEGTPGKISAYTDEQWRMHRWVYDRLIEEVDADIAPVVKALEDGGFMDNTFIVFMSDHGDMDASHHMEHKTAPFEESQKVPFIICGPGIRKGAIESSTVNTGIDLLPTLCDLAGIDIPDIYPGLSLKDLATGERDSLARKYIFCESSGWNQVIEDGRYKLTVLDAERGGQVILTDLKEDPGELRNLAEDPSYKDIVDRLKRILSEELSSRHRR